MTENEDYELLRDMADALFGFTDEVLDLLIPEHQRLVRNVKERYLAAHSGEVDA